MINGSVRQGIENVARFFAENPEKGLSPDKSAVAIVEEGLRCRAEGPNGAVMVSDMPKAIGGGGTAPTPGWFLRAALANCDATVIAMRAAQLGIDLTTLEVTVDSESDDRGLLGIGGAEVLPGPVGISVRVRIAAAGVPPEQLREIVAWAEAHSPVGDALRRALPFTTEIEVACADQARPE